jgi:hypothetical protein
MRKAGVGKEKKHKHLSQRLGKTSNLFATCLHKWVQKYHIIMLV